MERSIKGVKLKKNSEWWILLDIKWNENHHETTVTWYSVFYYSFIFASVLVTTSHLFISLFQIIYQSYNFPHLSHCQMPATDPGTRWQPPKQVSSDMTVWSIGQDKAVKTVLRSVIPKGLPISFWQSWKIP